MIVYQDIDPNSYSIETFCHIDDNLCTRSLERVLLYSDVLTAQEEKIALGCHDREFVYSLKEAYIENTRWLLSLMFKAKGWEGDGEIGGIVIPPFMNPPASGDTFSKIIFHVKQCHKGRSFLAIPDSLMPIFARDCNNELILKSYQ